VSYKKWHPFLEIITKFIPNLIKYGRRKTASCRTVQDKGTGDQAAAEHTMFAPTAINKYRLSKTSLVMCISCKRTFWTCDIFNLWLAILTAFAKTIRFCNLFYVYLAEHMMYVLHHMVTVSPMYSNYIKQMWWAAFTWVLLQIV